MGRPGDGAPTGGCAAYAGWKPVLPGNGDGLGEDTKGTKGEERGGRGWARMASAASYRSNKHGNGWAHSCAPLPEIRGMRFDGGGWVGDGGC